MSNLKALRNEASASARLSLSDIGGGKVIRAFRRGTEYVKVGTMVSAEEIAALQPSNRAALIGRFIAVWPKPSLVEAVTPPAEDEGVGAGQAERHVVALGFGRYSVIEGAVITEKAVSREEAYSIAGKPLPAAAAKAS